jgi:hypothetical protein
MATAMKPRVLRSNFIFIVILLLSLFPFCFAEDTGGTDHQHQYEQ